MTGDDIFFFEEKLDEVKHMLRRRPYTVQEVADDFFLRLTYDEARYLLKELRRVGFAVRKNDFYYSKEWLRRRS